MAKRKKPKHSEEVESAVEAIEDIVAIEAIRDIAEHHHHRHKHKDPLTHIEVRVGGCHMKVGVAFPCTLTLKKGGAIVDPATIPGITYTWSASVPSVSFDDAAALAPMGTGGAPETGVTVACHVAYSVAGQLFTHDGTSAPFDVEAVAIEDPVDTVEVTVG